jgi:GTP-binding protein
MSLPVVAIIGRPNVGKSSLFNRIAGERKAIVEDEPGTTRDRVEAEVEWRGRHFRLVDTGGLEPAGEGPYSPLVNAQIGQAAAEADVILFVIDGKHGLTATDLEVADQLRRARSPVLLVANKVDNVRREEMVPAFYELGYGEARAVSAFHASGVGDLLDEVVALLAPSETAETAGAVRIAIVGRPNVGKSAFLNAVLGQQRVIVSDIAGTTRDAIDTPFRYSGRDLVLVDTAGIRRRGKVEQGVEKHSVLRTESAIDRADVALLIVDATDPLTAQDLHIAGYIQEAYKGLVVVVNKWDLAEDETSRPQLERRLRWKLRFAPWAHVAFASALRREGVEEVLDLALDSATNRRQRVPTHDLNVYMKQAWATHHPPAVQGKRLKLLYVTQASTEPPTFIFFVNDPTLVHFSYRRYLENSVRQRWAFEGTAIKLVFKGRQETE